MSSTEASDTSYETPPVRGGVGLSNPQLGQGRRRMLDLVNKLHSTGVQVDIDLPQIAVIGAQSAGKSSLIESISGITLPRASGTCTRCPTECRLSHSSCPWQCVVSLRFITDSRGQPLGQARNQPFGPIIYDKSQVEERIRRAQKAILNPSKPAKLFLEGDDSVMNMTELTFSTNCVSLQISGPDVADLSFCDLPGLIASVSNNGNHSDIELVRRLVANYIKKPSCIILLTVACETDFENQGAHHLAKEYDPKGKRTIGVLTKPDRIPISEEDNWVPYIRNEKEPLDNNWFCVKQPSTEELKTIKSWDDARTLEEDWFSCTSPWCELDGVYQKYLRTSNLVERLSSVLSDLIAKRLPEIQEELDNAIARTQALISKLPREPAADPRSAICTLLHEYTIDLAHHVEGVPDDPDADEETGFGLIQAIRPTQERFRRAIRETAPNFRPFERKHASSRHLGTASFLESEEGFKVDGEASDDEGDATVQQKRPGSTFGLPKTATTSTESLDQTSKRKREVGGTKIYIDEVMDRALKARTRELPGHYPWIVQKTFIENIMKEWEVPALQLCSIVYETLDHHVKNLISRHFSDFGQGYLEQRVRAIMSNHLKQCLENCQKQVLWLLRLESRPFSLNTHYLEAYCSKFITYYRAAREKYEQGDLIGHIKQFNKPVATTQAAPSTFSFATPPATAAATPTITSTTATSAAGSGPSFPPSSSPFGAKFPPSTLFGAQSSSTPALPQAFVPIATSVTPTPSAPASITKILSGLAEIGLQGLKAEDLLRLIPSDPMEPALVIMADVRAYFQVAYKRFADNVPLAIDVELVQGAEHGILLELYKGLGINGEDGQRICQELAMESPQVADRRMDLMNKYKRLQAAKQELLCIGF
ncbi:P-loop containing nucleoside triphosphate hydrolase protein [Panaeolus papilionaceus]|nr:P-loop containing nucleoside triphosphate hydrolase protein [Panaeolus papilionaceus]